MKQFLKRVRSQTNISKPEDASLYEFKPEHPLPLQIFSANDMQARGVAENLRAVVMEVVNYLARSVGSQREVANVSHYSIGAEEFGTEFITFAYVFEIETAPNSCRGICPTALAHAGIQSHAHIEYITIVEVSEHKGRNDESLTRVKLRVRVHL